MGLRLWKWSCNSLVISVDMGMGNITPWLAAAPPPSAVSHTAKSCLGFSVHICKTRDAVGRKDAWSLLTLTFFS